MHEFGIMVLAGHPRTQKIEEEGGFQISSQPRLHSEIRSGNKTQCIIFPDSGHSGARH